VGYGAALCNLSYAYRLQGELARSLKALEQLNTYVADRPQSRIAGEAANKAAGLALELGYFEIAVRQQQRFAQIAGSLATPQERLVGQFIELLAQSLSGEKVDDWTCYRLIGAFTALPARPETTVVWPAILMRRGGNVDGARTYLSEAEQFGRLRIYDPPFVHEELARCAVALGEAAEAQNQQEQANAGFAALGMLKRRHTNPATEFGSRFRRPPGALKVVSQML
jgi:hypothetical protein